MHTQAGICVLQMCVLGGHNGSAWLETVTTHKPQGKKWGRLPDLDGPRSFAAADSWNKNIFIMGGGDGTRWFNSALRYAASKHKCLCSERLVNLRGSASASVAVQGVGIVAEQLFCRAVHTECGKPQARLCSIRTRHNAHGCPREYINVRCKMLMLTDSASRQHHNRDVDHVNIKFEAEAFASDCADCGLQM